MGQYFWALTFGVDLLKSSHQKFIVAGAYNRLIPLPSRETDSSYSRTNLRAQLELRFSTCGGKTISKMHYQQSIERKEYERALIEMHSKQEGPRVCGCGSDKLTLGGTHSESIIQCEKCKRFVAAPTIEDALVRWGTHI